MGFLLRAKTNTQARTPLNLKTQSAFASVLLSPKRKGVNYGNNYRRFGDGCRNGLFCFSRNGKERMIENETIVALRESLKVLPINEESQKKFLSREKA